MYPMLYIRRVTSQDLLCSTGNSAQCYMADWVGGEFGENGYLCLYD